MKKPKFLWHGSIKKLDALKPSQATDLSMHPDSNKKAVYATDLKELAIGFGLIERRYKKFADYNKKPVQMVLINGKIREGEKFYLYKISSNGFKEMPKNSHQWLNFSKVVPLEILKLNVDDYSYLVRKASKKDLDNFNKLVDKFSS